MNINQQTINRLARIVLVLFALAFMLTLHLRPYPLSYLIKAIPVFLLSFLVFYNVPGRRGRLIGLGLFFSGIGDVILDLPVRGVFIFGLISFAIAHLFYLAAFLRKLSISLAKSLLLALILFYSLAMILVLYPNMEPMMFLPIGLYLGVIVLMAISAILGDDNNRWIVVGALLFMISDSLIAITRFVLPVPFSSVWVMSSYYLAQLFIAYGAYLSFGRPSSGSTF